MRMRYFFIGRCPRQNRLEPKAITPRRAAYSQALYLCQRFSFGKRFNLLADEPHEPAVLAACQYMSSGPAVKDGLCVNAGDALDFLSRDQCFCVGSVVRRQFDSISKIPSRNGKRNVPRCPRSLLNHVNRVKLSVRQRV